MGTVHAKIKLDNPKRADLKFVEANALVDTGSLFLCLPEEVRLQLQLEATSEKEVTTADGKRCLCPYVGPVRGNLKTASAMSARWFSAMKFCSVPCRWKTWIWWSFRPFVGSWSTHCIRTLPLARQNNSSPGNFYFSQMTEDLQKRIQAALANPQNMGEMAGADSIGPVGNADCGEMLRLWVEVQAAGRQTRH